MKKLCFACAMAALLLVSSACQFKKAEVLAVSDASTQSSESSIASESEPEPELEDLFDEIAEAVAGETVKAFVADHENVIVEQVDETLGIERLDAFYEDRLAAKGDYDLYIARTSDVTLVIYRIQSSDGEPFYTLTIKEGGELVQDQMKVSEAIAKTDREYVLIAQPDFQKRAVEVGLQGEKGLTYNNRCTHTEIEDSIDSRLIEKVGTEAFNKWVAENESNTQCNINIYTFLKAFDISYQTLTETLGEKADQLYPMDEIVKQLYPEQLQSKPANTTADGTGASSSENAVVITGSNFLDDVESEIIRKINEERASLGLGQVQYDANLAAAARIRSRELSKSGVWAHTRPNGDSWITVLKTDVPVDYSTAGENLAMVQFNDLEASPHTDAAWWIEEWKNSPSHYSTMTKAEFTHIGAGVYYRELDDGSIVAHATTIFVKY